MLVGIFSCLLISGIRPRQTCQPNDELPSPENG